MLGREGEGRRGGEGKEGRGGQLPNTTDRVDHPTFLKKPKNGTMASFC